MTVFIVGTPFETAQALDSRRLNKQIIECQWIIDMAKGNTKPSKHPAFLMWKDHIQYILYYQECLKFYRSHLKDKESGNEEGSKLRLKLSIHASEEAEKFKPPFLCDELYNNFKKRLYTKNNEHYSQWKYLGESETNYYFVDGKWLAYTNGKKSIDDNFQKTS